MRRPSTETMPRGEEENEESVDEIIRKIVATVSPSKVATSSQISKVAAGLRKYWQQQQANGDGSDGSDGSPPANGGTEVEPIIRRCGTVPLSMSMSHSRRSSSATLPHISSTNSLPATASRAHKMLSIIQRDSHSPSPGSSNQQAPSTVTHTKDTLANPFNCERKAKQWRQVRRQRQQMAEARAHAMPLDMEEVHLSAAMAAVYDDLLHVNGDAQTIFHIIRRTLTQYYVRNTWIDTVEATLCQFVRQHMLCPISALKARQLEGSLDMEGRTREFELQTLLHLQSMAVYERQFSSITAFLRQIHVLSEDPSRMHRFLGDICMDEFEASCWRHLTEVFEEMGHCDMPTELEHRRRMENKGRTSSPTSSKKCKTNGSSMGSSFSKWAASTSTKSVTVNDTAATPVTPDRRRKHRRVLKSTIVAHTPPRLQMSLAALRDLRCRRRLSVDQLNDSVDDTPMKEGALSSNTVERKSLVSLLAKVTRRRSSIANVRPPKRVSTGAAFRSPDRKRRRQSELLLADIALSSCEKDSPSSRLRARGSMRETQLSPVKAVVPILNRAKKTLLQSPVKMTLRVSPPTSPPKPTPDAASGQSPTSKYRRLPRLALTAQESGTKAEDNDGRLGEWRLPTNAVDNYLHSVRSLRVRRKDGEYPVFYGRHAVRVNVFSTSAEQVGRLMMNTRQQREGQGGDEGEKEVSCQTRAAAKHVQAKNRSGKKCRTKTPASNCHVTSMGACALLNVANDKPEDPWHGRQLATKQKRPAKVPKCARVHNKVKHARMQRRVRALHERVSRLAAAKETPKVDVEEEEDVKPTPWTASCDVASSSGGSELAARSANGGRDTVAHSVDGSPTAKVVPS